MTFMLQIFIFLYNSHKFLDDDFNFDAKQIKTKIPTTTQGSNTGFVGQNPIRKGFFPTSYGKILCTQFSPKLLEFLSKGYLRETGRVELVVLLCWKCLESRLYYYCLSWNDFIWIWNAI